MFFFSWFLEIDRIFLHPDQEGPRAWEVEDLTVLIFKVGEPYLLSKFAWLHNIFNVARLDDQRFHTVESDTVYFLLVIVNLSTDTLTPQRFSLKTPQRDSSSWRVTRQDEIHGRFIRRCNCTLQKSGSKKKHHLRSTFRMFDDVLMATMEVFNGFQDVWVCRLSRVRMPNKEKLAKKNAWRLGWAHRERTWDEVKNIEASYSQWGYRMLFVDTPQQHVSS